METNKTKTTLILSPSAPSCKHLLPGEVLPTMSSPIEVNGRTLSLQSTTYDFRRLFIEHIRKYINIFLPVWEENISIYKKDIIISHTPPDFYNICIISESFSALICVEIINMYSTPVM